MSTPKQLPPVDPPPALVPDAVLSPGVYKAFREVLGYASDPILPSDDLLAAFRYAHYEIRIRPPTPFYINLHNL